MAIIGGRKRFNRFLLQARDVFEEGVQTVKTARDFSQIFEAYAEFEQSTLEKLIEVMSDTPSAEENAEMELRMARSVGGREGFCQQTNSIAN